MHAANGTDPIDDGEILYRRVPASTGWYDPRANPPLSPKAFHPIEGDATGLSVYRATYTSLADAAKGRAGKRYYVAVMRAGDLRREGIAIEPRPLPGDPGHAELPGLTYVTRYSDGADQAKVLLAHRLCLRVEGPFPAVEADP